MKVKIEFTIEVPDLEKHSIDEFEEYLRYHYGFSGGMSVENPFCNDGQAPIPVGSINWNYA